MTIRTIDPDPNKAYDRNEFVNAMEDFSTLERLVQGLGRDSSNPKLMQGAGELLQDDTAFYSGLHPQTVRSDVECAAKESSEKIRDFTEKNFSALFEELDGKDLYEYLLAVDLHETGKEEEDKAVKAVNKFKEIARIKKGGGIEQYVDERMANAEKWRKESYFKFNRGNKQYVLNSFEAYERQAKLDLAEAVTKEDDGKREPDKSKIAEIIKGSLEKAKAEGKAGQYYLELAHRAYEKIAESRAA